MEEATSQPAPARNPLVGQRIGSYRVLDTLGQGGMSTVYRAVHLETGHEVALKVLAGSLSRSSTLLQRFLREARSAENLEHSHIVTIYDRGVDQGRHYLVLEYVAGGDFHDYVQRNGPLGAAEAIAVVRGVASGLRYAARRGLIHRDIKPSNILRAPTGEPKIIDLGLALQSEFEDERVTREGTTVGTVDYMSPEQARDSRATSIHSDMYSLGCTFYYLLAGVPPFPGGDITEKLTRHARAPAPDIRDLRPEIPPAVSAIVRRMMAKHPEERFADYDQLIGALDAAGRGDGGYRDEGSIPLVPLEGDEPVDAHARAPEPNLHRLIEPRTPDDDEGAPMLLEPLGGLSLDLAVERDPVNRRSGGNGAEVPLPRLGRTPILDEDEDEEPAVEADVAGAPASMLPAVLPRLMIQTAAAAALAVLLVGGLYLIFGRPEIPEPIEVATREPEPGVDLDGAPRTVMPAPRTKPGTGRGREDNRARREEKPSGQPVSPPKPTWTEPADQDPVAGESLPIPSPLHAERGHLPEWTRAPVASRPEDPAVVVRRVAAASDGNTEPSLHHALDRYKGGVVELADVGPLPVEELRVSGEARIIRPRRGYRPILRVQRSKPSGPALEQSAFLVLDRKSLTLEGVDLIVDARDLSGKQTALFSCSGSNLTLRDCSITVLNPTRAPFTLIRQDPPPRQEPTRPSRIWLERTLVRGRGVTVAELTGGPADLVLDGSAILVGGLNPAGIAVVSPAAPGGVRPPIVKVTRPEGSEERRIFLANALVACPGPVMRLDQPAGPGAPGKPLAIRLDNSALGRLAGPGIASIVAAADDKASAGRQVAWAGDHNLYAGWKGFFARGNEPRLTVEDLSRARSTWNATEQGSQWLLLSDWSLPGDPSRWVASQLDPFLPAAQQSLLGVPARPGPALFPKTIESYPDPIVPEPAPRLIAGPTAAIPIGSRAVMRIGERSGPFTPANSGDPRAAVQGGDAPTPGSTLVMETSDSRWGGDLGEFLRSAIPRGERSVRVRVVGSGLHRFTPVRLPDGLTLEIRVEVDPKGDGSLPTWLPASQSTGPGLMELRGGALVLSNLHLKHESGSRLESLIALDDSHLVLIRSELTVPPDPGNPEGDLIAFRSPTTRPIAALPGASPFQVPVDRPVCRLIDSILIARQTALRAELGRGLVALTRCAIASDETAIALEPARVARRSLDADLWLDRCTVLAGRSIIALGPWPGLPSGPVRPWVINSRQCAFFTIGDARTRDAVLLRADADAHAGGCLFWQADDDAYNLDRVVAAGEVAPAPSGRGEVSYQWDHLLWPANHKTRTVTGPRSVLPRLRQVPRPGRIEPGNLILEPAAGRGAGLGAGAGPGGIAPGPQSPSPFSRTQ